jgi:hypothetical protein
MVSARPTIRELRRRALVDRRRMGYHGRSMVRTPSTMLAFGALLVAIACGGSSQPAEEPGFQKSKEEQPWPPPSLGVPERREPAPPPAEGPGAAAGAPQGAPGGGVAGGATAPKGALTGCNPGSQEQVMLFDCPWGVALYGRPAGKVPRGKAIEALMEAVLGAAQVKVSVGKAVTTKVAGQPLKGVKLAVKHPDPPHGVVAEGSGLFVAEAADANIMVCLRAKEDSQADRCQGVFEELLKNPPGGSRSP